MRALPRPLADAERTADLRRGPVAGIATLVRVMVQSPRPVRCTLVPVMVHVPLAVEAHGPFELSRGHNREVGITQRLPCKFGEGIAWSFGTSHRRQCRPILVVLVALASMGQCRPYRLCVAVVVRIAGVADTSRSRSPPGRRFAISDSYPRCLGNAVPSRSETTP